MPMTPATSFGDLLKQLRKRAGMTQSDLAAALGYSFSLICALERNRRLPDMQAVMQSYIAALGLQDEPRLAAQLVELAARARDEKPPTLTIQRERRLVLTEEVEELPYHLPLPPTPLLGRDQEVKQLCQRLQGHSGRLMTLVGPPGVGKTRLALAVATALHPLYRDGACFIPLAAIDDPALIAPTLVSALKLQEVSAKPPQARLIEHLRRKELLLVLDNFEQLMTPRAGERQGGESRAAVQLVATLLAECAGLRILVTSRERLHLRAEQRYKAPPLDLAPAITLFVQRAQAVEPAFALTTANQTVIAAICQKLDCLPLAIELSAAQCELLTPSQLFTRLQHQPLTLLAHGADDLPAHQRSLRLAIDHSYRTLAAPEQQLFRTLGVFVGGFDLAAVAHLGFSETTLQRLIDKSLVASTMLPQHAAGERRFFLLETLRAYALEQVSAVQEASAFARHATYFLALAEAAADKMADKAQVRWLDRLDVELENLRAAFHWFLRHEPAQALALAGALKEFWLLRGYYQEGRQWLAQVLTEPAPPPIRARALLAAGQLANRQGEATHALTLVQESLALYDQTGDHWAVADGWRIIGWIYDELHQREPKIAAFEESLHRFRQLGDAARTATLLVSLVYAYGAQQMGYTQARSALQEAITLLRTTSDSEALLFALTMQGDVDIQFDHYEDAALACAEAVTLARAAGYKRHLAWALIRHGEIKRHCGEAASAVLDLQEALQLSQVLGDKDALVGAWRTLGDAQRSAGAPNAACTAYVQAINFCQETNNRHQAIHCLIGCAVLAFDRNQLHQAARFVTKAQQWADILPPFLAVRDRKELADLLTTIRQVTAADAFAEMMATTQEWALAEVAVQVQALCQK